MVLGRREGRVHRGERVWVARTQPHPNVLVGAEGFGHPVALTGWLEADQAELTVLHRPEDEGALRATGYRFCASRAGREPTGRFACAPKGQRGFY